MIKSIPLGGAPEQAYADGKGMINERFVAMLIEERNAKFRGESECG